MIFTLFRNQWTPMYARRLIWRKIFLSSKNWTNAAFSPISSSPLVHSNGSCSIDSSSCLQTSRYSSVGNGVVSKARHLATSTTGRIKMATLILLGLSFISYSLYELLGGRKKEDDNTKVMRLVKKNLFKTERALQRGDYRQAETACHTAMAILGNSKAAEEQSYLEASAIVMDKLANIYLEQKKWKEAEMLFKETLRVMIKAGVPQDNDAVIEISLKLARIYHNQQRYDIAESGFQWCVDVAKEKWESDKTRERYALFGMCLEYKAQFYLMFGHHDTAIKDFSEILDISKSVYGSSHLQVAVCYNNLATALDASKQYDRAVDLSNKSIELAESLPQQDDSDPVDERLVDHYVAIFYINLGTIHSNNGKHDLAELAYDRAEPFAKKTGEKQLLNKIDTERMKISLIKT